MKKLFSILLLCVLIIFAGCAPRESRYSITWLDTFDTVVTLTGYAESKEMFDKASQEVHAELIRLDSIFDAYEEHPGVSGVWALNQNEGQPMVVEAELCDLLVRVTELHETAQGRVNPAIGAVTFIWKEARETGSPPDQQALVTAGEHCDFSLVQIDASSSTVALTDPLLRLDLGAVAKGYAVEKAAQLLGMSMPCFLIDAGGNIRAGEVPAGGINGRDSWNIGVEDPQSPGDILTTLPLKNGSAVTSGGYQRLLVVDGKEYHHLIDPDTLYPADFCLQTTIVCADSFLADFLSTATFLLEESEAVSLVSAFEGVSLLRVDNEGELLQCGETE